MYSERLMDHFRNPRNVGEIPDADGTATREAPACQDVMSFYLKFNGDIIREIKFKSHGCTASIAAGSITTEFAKGKSIQEARSISSQQVSQGLGGLPEAKMHCAELAEETLRASIDDFLSKKRNK